MKQADVYIHAANALCAAGNSLAEINENLAHSGRHWLTITDQYSPNTPLPVGQVNGELPNLEAIPKSYHSRSNQLLFAALAPLKSTLASLRKDIANDRIAIILGTSTSGISEGEQDMAHQLQQGEWPEHFDYNRQTMVNPATALATILKVEGPCFVISTACSSGAKALASARRLLQAGLCDIAIAGGVDSLCRLTVQGFSALDAVSPEPCLPSSINRQGINIGEGAALFILSKRPATVKLSGVGESSDAYHFSAPHPEGKGAITAMQAALKDAGLSGADIDYLNLHGTATEQNDKMESLAVAHCTHEKTLCSSTKSYMGHTLGAAGAIEAAICWQCLAKANTSLPVHLWDNSPDPALSPLQWVTNDNQNTVINTAMTNSFAFGGNNISLVMERDQA